ncbi:MAG: UDP-N-acetylmuramate dehydrogenase [Clostridia bacterium]|nr:UDP-N-acetylmuramate dehydrogenase [Clostridia bacterium]
MALNDLLAFESLKFDFNASKLFSFKTGGRVKGYFETSSLKELRDFIELLEENCLKYKIIGNGSNILLSDNGFDGYLISLKRLSSITQISDLEVKVGAGVLLNSLISYLTNHSLSGLEELVNIPATIGGALYMNAGAFNREISNNLTCVEILKKGKIIKLDPFDCAFFYRKSNFSKDEVIISANFIFKKEQKETILSKQNDIIKLRIATQPKGRTCGSVFKNLKNIHVAKLIDEAGLKGYKIGGAIVSNKHANFIIAEDGCTSYDIFELILHIKKKIFEKYKINLVEEIEYLGEF